MLSSPVSAQENCDNHGEILRELAKKYGEYLTGFGLSHRGYIVEIIIDPNDGSWTILALKPDGCTLYLDGGEAWSEAPTIKGKDS